MSFILDSLRKVERQRRGTHVPTIETTHVPPPSSRSSRRVWPWVLALVLVANGAVLAVALRRAPDTRTAAVPAPPSAPSAATHPARTPPATTPEPTSGLPVPAPAPTQHPRRAVEAPAPPANPGVEHRLAPNAKASVTRPAERRLAHTAPAVVPASPRRNNEADADRARSEAREAAAAQSRAIESGGVSSARVGPPAGASATAPAPAATSATTSTAQAKDPKLRLDALVYSEVAIERMVFINGHKYVEGQHVDDRTVVERITPDGAMISTDGQRFLLKQ